MGNRLDKASNEDDRNTKHVLLRMSEAEYWEPLKNKSIAEYLDENDETRESKPYFVAWICLADILDIFG